MTIQDIREVMHHAIPFQIKTSDGSVYAVRHPDFVMVSDVRDGIVVVHTESGLAILSLANITAIELSGDRASAA